MSRKTQETRSKTAATQAAALCVGVGVCWLVATFVVSPTRQLSAGANDQPDRPQNIRLGLPTFNSADSARSAGNAATTAWKTPDEDLQLVRAYQRVEGADGQIVIQPRARIQSQHNSHFRPVSQSAAQIAGVHVAEEFNRRQKEPIEEWSVPGRHNPWNVAQVDSQPDAGSPQHLSDAEIQSDVAKELELVPAMQPNGQSAGMPAMPLPSEPRPNQNVPPSTSGAPQDRPQASRAAPADAVPVITPPPVSSPPVYVAPDGGYKTFPADELPVAPTFQALDARTNTNPVPSIPLVPEPVVKLPVEEPIRPVPQPQSQLQPQQMLQPEVIEPQPSSAPVQTQSAVPQPLQFQIPQYSQPVPQPPQFAAPTGSVPSQQNPQYGIHQGMAVPQNGMSIHTGPGTQSGDVYHSYSQPMPGQESPQHYPQGVPFQGEFIPDPNSEVYDNAHFGHAIQPQQLFGHSLSGSYPGTSGFRATVESDADYWMAPYASRALNSVAGDASPVIPNIPEIPAGFAPWWDAAVQKSLGVHSSSHSVNVSSLLEDALVHSPQVIAIKTEPEIQYRVVTQESAKFDWSAFLEATYDDLNDPVGSDLTTGNGEDRLLTRKALASGGFRRRNLEGGELRIAQDLGHENQNSRFFVPNNQGSTRLELSYRQPLMDGAGRAYNESEIVLARIQANTSEDEVVDALQDHLTEVTEAYWTLYRARAEFFQRQKLLASAQEVLLRLEGRSQVDTIPRQILRARAAVARSQTRIQRTVARVRDAEAQLRLLVNSPEMLNSGQVELMPTEPPRLVTETADLQSVLQTALINRPDISEAIRKMRAAGVRLGVSKTELLPRLDFVVETYVADLAGNSDVQQAFRGQLLDNRPGYTLGLEFEIPIGNRAAIAKLEQREWELKRSVSIFQATVEKSLTDVEIANREVQTAYSEILSRYQSMKASDKESRYLKDRFEVLPAAEDSATLLLEDLLDSFERLADEETAFVQAQVDHAVALIKLKKELGTLLRSRNSRPQLNGEQEAWMSGRVGDSGAIFEQDFGVYHNAPYQHESIPVETEVFEPISDSRTLPSAGHQFPTMNSRSSSTGKNLHQPEGFVPETGAEGVPVPLTPTTWRRPRASLLGGY